jgi:hypothetical protein
MPAPTKIISSPFALGDSLLRLDRPIEDAGLFVPVVFGPGDSVRPWSLLTQPAAETINTATTRKTVLMILPSEVLSLRDKAAIRWFFARLLVLGIAADSTSIYPP